MASYVKSVGLLVIIVAVLCSPVHGRVGIFKPFKFPNFKSPKPPTTLVPSIFPPIIPRAPKSHTNAPGPPKVPTKTPINTPRAPPGNNPPIFLQTAQEFGLSLAFEYFGDETINDFRWGYNQGKLIQSAAQKCTKALNFTSCPQAPQPSPLSPESAPQPQPSSLSKERAIYCIVEVTDSENGICGQQYESHTVPPEAICELDHPDELNATNCVPM